jgi:hypothetical protein
MAQFTGLPSATQKWNSLFGLYLKIAPGIFLFGGGFLILIFGFKLFVKKPVLPGAFGFQALALVVVFVLGHLLTIKDLGVLTTLSTPLMKFSSGLGLVLIFFSALGLAVLIQKRTLNKIMLRLLLTIVLMIAITGVVLWQSPGYSIGPGLFFPMAHGLLAVLIAGVFLCLVLFKKDKTPDE